MSSASSSVKTLFEKLTTLTTTHWNALTPPQKALTTATAIISTAFISISSYIVYYRITEKQKPFNSYTTSEQAINGKDLSNKYAIVTGSNTGVGKETAKILYKYGCNVIMACRSLQKGNEARQDIINQVQNNNNNNNNNIKVGSITVLSLDLSSLQSVRDFAKKFVSTFNGKLDYLINNAGIMALPNYSESTDGIESQFAVNHIGHYYLTRLLLNIMIKNKTRIINLSSVAHARCDYNLFNNFLDYGIKNKVGPNKANYDPLINYGISKTCNILFARELNRLYSKSSIISVSLHPGWVAESDLSRNVKPTFSAMIRYLFYFFLNVKFIMNNYKNLSQGASTTLRMVSMNDNEIIGGEYYVNCNVGELIGAAKDSKFKQYNNYESESIEAKLWQLSELLIKERGFSLAL